MIRVKVTRGEAKLLLWIRKGPCTDYLKNHVEELNGHFIGDKCWMGMIRGLNQAMKGGKRN